jgi:hypothetical protein
MQPYQEATQEIRRQGEAPLKIAKNAAAVGSAALAAGSVGRILPFLSKYVPEDLAIKGLNKIDPRFGSFIQKAMDAGESFSQVKEQIESKMEGASETEKAAKQDKNIIERESPELHTFIDQEIRNGRKPIEVAAIAQNDKRFASTIQKLMKEHKTPWSQIIESIYGSGESALSGQPQQAQSQQGFPPPPQQGGQGGPGQQALMGILAKINQKLGQ